MKTIFTVLALTLLSTNSFANTQEMVESFWAEYCPTVSSMKQTENLSLFCKMKDLKKNRRELISFYKDVSVLTGEVRFDNWKSLSLEKRQRLENLEFAALNISSALITDKVDEVLGGKH